MTTGSRCNVTREQVEDLKSFHNIDIEAEFISALSEEINKEIVKNLQNLSKSREIKRVYSDLDPYGEEVWED